MPKVLIHDWAGHAFPIGLSRELARRGFNVQHIYFAGVQGPKGPLERLANDPANFAIVPIAMAASYTKYAYLKRWFQERKYAAEIVRHIRGEAPDYVISSNTPLDVQRRILSAVKGTGGSLIYWLQDFQSLAMKAYLPRRIPVLGRWIAWFYEWMERRILRRSAHIVCISSDFAAILKGWRIDGNHISVIENWTPKSDIRPLPKDNAWSRAHGLAGKRVFLCAGTLGLKHNPDLLWRLAMACSDDPSLAVVVASEGIGADWLKERLRAMPLVPLAIVPFQSYDSLPEMLATGDVLLSIIEPDAGRFSVPSKVLSYLAAARPVLLSVPRENLAARIVSESGAGIVVSPGDIEGFIAKARGLMANPVARQSHAAAARRYADDHFDIERITDRFMAVMEKARPD
jgi:glycosyltransferase involved in cell wall biosynthesis